MTTIAAGKGHCRIPNTQSTTRRCTGRISETEKQSPEISIMPKTKAKGCQRTNVFRAGSPTVNPSIRRIPVTAMKTKQKSPCMKGVASPSIRRIQQPASPCMKRMARPSLRRILIPETKRKPKSSCMKGMESPIMNRILASATEMKTASTTPVILPESYGRESQYDTKQKMKKAFDLVRNDSQNTKSNDITNPSATPTGAASVIANRNQRKDTAATRCNADREKVINNRIPDEYTAAAYHADIIPNIDKTATDTRSPIIGEKGVINRMANYSHSDDY